MQTIYFPKTNEINRTRLLLEKSLDIKIKIQGKKISFSSKDSLKEYEASIILEAINFGFSANKALQLKYQDNTFRILHIKDLTRRKNLKEVKARIIGKKGRTKKTIENISDCYLIIKDNEIGIIADTNNIEEITVAISNLIKGTKQSNTYRYLEKTNKRKSNNLGLKTKNNKIKYKH